jgi:hypothetical protein
MWPFIIQSLVSEPGVLVTKQVSSTPSSKEGFEVIEELLPQGKGVKHLADVHVCHKGAQI